ncbi:hypothetical protein EVJ58_g969 [Rhodofomes roseus]|uniref:Uncharacterized protein n=1 Tax=Rhodofomes roseus TaxID=34475 RepID=A0A4Y9Z1Y8_9APHY|nr:hypothetical protein EVJ58_g969 [Rhodofomes roseus]
MHVVHMYEEQETMVDGEKNKEEIGGEAKATQMLYGALAVELTDPETPLGELLDELASLCREHYLTFKPKVKPLAAPSDERLRQKMLDFEEPVSSDSEGEHPMVTSVMGSQTLSTHRKVYNAFRRALDEPEAEWDLVAVIPDQFNHPVFKNSAMNLRRIERSSQLSSGSKRRLEGESADMTRPGPSKRMRSATMGLESLEEEGSVALHAGGQ